MLKKVNVVNRTLCDVFEEMRTALKSLNFSYMGSLIEEAQMMGNRMESSLYDKKDFERLRKDIREREKELKELTEKIESKKEDV